MTTAQLARRLGVAQPRIVPRRSLEELVDERAAALAKKRLAAARHTMALENQSVEPTDEAAQLEQLTRSILAQRGSRLWDEE